jgi:hypothetical protein
MANLDVDVKLSVAGPVPRRTQSGRCAGRDSPNAAALFTAATKIIAESPRSFPLRGKVGIAISSGVPLPSYDGYDAASAIEEVLVDARLLEDERQVDREWLLIDPTLRNRYIVVVRPGPPFR